MAASRTAALSMPYSTTSVAGVVAMAIRATVTGCCAPVVKVQGEFVWHTHEDTDELFLVIDGTLTIQLRDGDVTLTPGQLYVVPRGVEHCPVGDARVLLIEPRGTRNTGDAGGPMTAPEREL